MFLHPKDMPRRRSHQAGPWTLLAALLAWTAIAGAVPGNADERTFHDKIAPILEQRCLHCHQGAEPKGGLSLESRAQALAGGDSGPGIAPGKPEQSLLLTMVAGNAPAMPKNDDPLESRDLELLRQWIRDGAAWPTDRKLIDKRAQRPWWSLKPLTRPTVPTVATERARWVRTPIDAFIADQHRRQGLLPSPEADRRTLIRRLSVDLHGLPPAPAEVEAFVQDASADAYEKLVDRLLASPRYGERWGRHWLDVVHYGETHGYDKDKPRRHAWPYRDYVIRAFNEDRPYSRFVQEQLAGDLLFPESDEGIVATGFIVAGPWDFVGHVELREGTVDKKIARVNDRDDMLANTMSTFQSLTVHCARCHDHKFDPIPQTDYYRLQAVFAGIDRADRPFDPDPQVARARKELLKTLSTKTARLQELETIASKQHSPELERLESQRQRVQAELASLPKPVATAGSPTNGYHSAIMPQPDAEKWVQVDLGASKSLDAVRLIPARPTDFRDSPGFGFPLRFRVEIANQADFSDKQMLADHSGADVKNPEDNPWTIEAKGGSARFIRVTATRLWKRNSDYVFALAELQADAKGVNLAAGATVTAKDSIEAGRWSTKYLVDGHSSRAALTSLPTSSETVGRRKALEQEISNVELQLTQQRLALLAPAVREELVDLRGAVESLARRLAELPASSFVYAAASQFAKQGNFTPSESPRPVHLLHRGDVKSPGPLMLPGALSCLEELPGEFQLPPDADEASRRAALARWITDARNPLTRRSIVNRVWHYHFGKGLVDSPNDFGRMGARPTHPELLDWLASEFVAQGESLKRLHRLIVTSAVYRQASAPNAAQEQIDAGNRYLWRFDRLRLDAESLRDAMLFASGQLDLTMGGPSVEQFFFKDDHSPVYDYTRFDVDRPESRRRSIYRFLVRSVPDPFMETFDCADPSICTAKRSTTLTALQALALLNNPFVVRQSEHFAARLRSISDNRAGQIDAACRIALGRPANSDETKLLGEYANQHGLENLCRLLFNSNEFLFID